MFIQASQLIGQRLLIDELDEHAGSIDRIIFEPETGRVLAFGVNPGGWFSQEKFLATNDILDISRNGVVIRDPDQLEPLDELIRVQEALEQRIPILGQPAQTQSGSSLGRIDDLLIDTDSWLVTKYYLRSLLDERILPASQVHSMTPKRVIFLDQTAEPNATGSQEPEVVAA